jgi:putative Ca2+/H+ antiporter (TMEM165/GDT1 family)
VTPVEFIVIVGVTLLAEITDKSMVATVLVSRRTGPARTISAAVVAVGLESLVVAELAGLVRHLLEGTLLRDLTSGVLAALGVVLIAKGIRDRDELPSEPEPHGWLQIAALFFVAELGDVTQATTAGFALATGAPVLVAIAATLGMGMAISLAVALRRYTRRLPERVLYLIAGGVLLVLAGLSLTGIGL